MNDFLAKTIKKTPRPTLSSIKAEQSKLGTLISSMQSTLEMPETFGPEEMRECMLKQAEILNSTFFHFAKKFRGAHTMNGHEIDLALQAQKQHLNTYIALNKLDLKTDKNKTLNQT